MAGYGGYIILSVLGTSGDTGGAAIHSVRGLQWLDMVVLLPKGRCTDIQERQMTTVMDDNVHVYRGQSPTNTIHLPNVGPAL